MAVIRQQTQVFNKPVGVRRINTGEAELWETVASEANKFSERAYLSASAEAKKVGKEQAMAVSSSDIVALDPITNKPVSYKPPPKYGEIAAGAYQEIINARFQQSVDNELVAQGARYAKFARNADEYNELISSHVANMINADSENTYFSRYISEAGTSYAASTYTSMKAAELENERESIIRADRANGFDSMAAIKEAITSGATNHEDVLISIDKQTARYVRLYASKGITFDQYTSSVDEINSLKLLSAHTSLSQQFSEFDSVQKAEFLSVLATPEKIKNIPWLNQEDKFNLENITVDALIDTKPETLANALESVGARSEEYVNTSIDSAVTKLLPQLDYVTSIEDINQIVKQTPIEIRSGLKKELINHMVSMRIDFATETEFDINRFQLELNRPNPDAASIKALLDEHWKSTNELVPDTAELAKFLIDIGNDGRKDILANLSKKIVHINKRNDLEVNKQSEKLQVNARKLKVSNNPFIDFRNSKEYILKSNITDKNSEINKLENVFGHRMSEIASTYNVPYNELKKIKSILDNPSDHDSTDLSANAKAALITYQEANSIIPTVVSRQIDARLKDVEEGVENRLEQIKLQSITNGIENQSKIQPDDLKFFQDKIFGKDFTITSDNLEQSKILFNGLLDNNMYPAVKNYFENAIGSTNEEDLNKAVGLWFQYANGQTTSNGTQYKGDRLKNVIDRNIYNKYAAAHYTAKKENILPSTALAELNAYDGNISQDILSDLKNGEGGTHSSLYRVFDDRNMSPNYKYELIAAMKMGKARNQTIDKEYLDNLIDNYTKNSLTRSDSNVLSPTIDGASEYALSMHIGKNELLESYSNLADAIIQNDPNSMLIGETTTFDQLRQVIRDSTGLNSGLIVGTVLEALGIQEGSYDASANLLNQDRIRKGLDTIQAHIVWKPDVLSFNNEQPKWTAGYIDDNERWVAIEINDEPWVLKRSSTDGEKSQVLFLANQNHTNALKGGSFNEESKKFLHKSFIEVLAARAHFEKPSQLKKLPEYSEMLEVYTEQEIIEIFNAKRNEYLGVTN